MATPRQKALALAGITVIYNLIEGAVAIAAAWMAGSTALVGFGLDSFVESLSGLVILWRFWQFGLDTEQADVAQAEHRATRLVGWSFFVLGGYVVVDAGRALWLQEAAQPSRIGIVLALLSLVIMPGLYWLKYRLARRIESRSLLADAKETLACSLLSLVLLAGLGANYLWRLWWIDPAAALLIAAWMFHEGWELLEVGGED